MFLLAIDIGNSRIKFGLFERETAPSSLPYCRNAVAVEIGAPLPWEQIRRWNDGRDMAGLIAGANPRGAERVLGTWPIEFTSRPRILRNHDQFPLNIRVDEPRRVGVDRLLNAVAANVRRAAEQPAIIVDIGTATTVDVVSADGAFEGGAILPGFLLCAKALHDYTALLPLLTAEELDREPHPPLGRNTRAAIRSGLYWGQLGAIRELMRRLTSELPSSPSPLILLTGGGAGLIATEFPEAQWEPHLALQGMILAAEAAMDADE